MEIRVATAADITQLDVLFGASYPVLLAPDYEAELLRKALPVMARAQPALVTCGTYYVAERAGRVGGGAGWTRGAPGSGAAVEGQAHIRHVVVDHRQVRQGLARGLLGRVFEDARAAGIRRLDCTSTRTAVPFYRAMGFAVLRDVDIPLAPDCAFPAVEMTRAL